MNISEILSVSKSGPSSKSPTGQTVVSVRISKKSCLTTASTKEHVLLIQVSHKSLFFTVIIIYYSFSNPYPVNNLCKSIIVLSQILLTQILIKLLISVAMILILNFSYAVFIIPRISLSNTG